MICNQSRELAMARFFEGPQYHPVQKNMHHDGGQKNNTENHHHRGGVIDLNTR